MLLKFNIYKQIMRRRVLINIFLLTLLSIKSKSYYTLNNKTIDKNISSLVQSNKNQTIIALTSNDSGRYVQTYDNFGQLTNTSQFIAQNNSYLFGFFELIDGNIFIIFQANFNRTQIVELSNQLNMANKTSFNFTITSVAARKMGSSNYLSFCLQSGEWKQYKVDNSSWSLASNGPLTNTYNYTVSVYTSDGAIICLGGFDKANNQNWEIICFDTNNSSEIIRQKLNAISVEIDSFEIQHSYIVNINKTALYILSLDNMSFTQVNVAFNSLVQYYAIKSCNSASKSQLAAILGRDDSNINQLILTTQQGQNFNVFQNQQFAHSIDISKITLSNCNYNYLIGFQANSLYIINESSEQIGIWPIIFLSSLAFILITLTMIIYKKLKFIFLKIIKIYYRTNKIVYIMCAFLISFLTLKMMHLILQQGVFITQMCISFLVQYFLFTLVITLYQCKTQFDEQTNHLKFYKLQGIPIHNYFFLRITFILLITGILSIFNALAIGFFNNNTIKIQKLQDYIILIFDFFLCTLSNLGFCLLITLMIKNFYVLVEMIFFYHFLTLFSMNLIQNQPIFLPYYLYFNGIYTYYYIFNSYLNHVIQINNNNKSNEDTLIGLLFALIQALVYFITYFIIIYARYRSTNTQEMIIQPQSSGQGLLMQNSSQYQHHNILEVSNLCKKMKNNKILSNITFQVIKGEIFVIYGQNQTGKTTLINILLSLQKYDSGSIEIKRNQKIQCCLQTYNCFQQLTFIEHIQFLCQIKNIKRNSIPQIVQNLIDDFYFSRDANKKASQLSGGSLKKLCLALTFIGKPDLLILDEPSLGLDTNFKIKFWKMLKQRKEKDKLTIIVTTQNKQEAEYLGDHIFLISRNKTISFFGQNHNYYVVFKELDSLNFKMLKRYMRGVECKVQFDEQKRIVAISLLRQQLIDQQFIHKLLFDAQLGFNYEILQTSKIEINEFQMQGFNFFDLHHQNERHFYKFQIEGLILRRLNIQRYYAVTSIFTFTIQIIVLNIVKKYHQQIIMSFFLLMRFFIYFGNGVIRNEEIIKKRYKHTIIIGMSKAIYWIFSIASDIIILFVIIELVYVINEFVWFLIRHSFSFDWLLCLFLLLYSCLYVAITYILSNLITNYISYLFFFFYFNGFCFFFVLYTHYGDIYPKLLLKDYYFSETFIFFNLQSRDYELILYLLLQTVIWYLILFAQLIIIEKTGSQQKITGFINRTYLPCQDQRKEQYEIENIQNQSVIPLVGDYIFHSYNSNQYILKNISILLKKGEIYGLIGSNGAGKSTLLNIISGVLQPNSGIIKFYGKDLKQMTFLDHTRIGYCPQVDYLHQILTVQQNIHYFCKIKGMKWTQIKQFTQKYLEYFEIKDQINTKVNQLSRGDRRKVSSIITFAGNPSILLFDQPSSGMDKDSKTNLWNLISAYCRRYQACALLTTHHIAEAEKYCDRIGILKNGKLISIGKPEDIVKKYSYKYRLIVKYKSLSQIDQIKQIAQRRQSFFQVFEPYRTGKIIYDFEKSNTNYRSILKEIILGLLGKGKLQYFEFYEHNLQNAITYIENSASPSGILSDRD